MPGWIEQPLVFDCRGDSLIGIVTRPREMDRAARVGLVIVVGGPQYRVGSHRHFVTVARRAADAGFATLRFDNRGMGDSAGEPQSFDAIDDDIGAAVEALMKACPQVRKVALWGLCDGASAALLYWRRVRDRRVAALCLLNPWVRSEATLARARVRHYYMKRFLSGDFWGRALRERSRLAESIRGWLRDLALARQAGRASGGEPGFRKLMAEGLRDFGGAILLVLSGGDATAQEFIECVRSDAQWDGVLDPARVERLELPHADHTFSSPRDGEEVADATARWLRALASATR